MRRGARRAAGLGAWLAFAAAGGALRRLLQRGLLALALERRRRACRVWRRRAAEGAVARARVRDRGRVS